mmetsp:Transcript_9409/g.22620  ORF Transcript_9409/g.22620 Transcript_9409/m.22620 type:complete len:241 (-) Transcript_9409:416-1138(-)
MRLRTSIRVHMHQDICDRRAKLVNDLIVDSLCNHRGCRRRNACIHYNSDVHEAEGSHSARPEGVIPDTLHCSNCPGNCTATTNAAFCVAGTGFYQRVSILVDDGMIVVEQIIQTITEAVHGRGAQHRRNDATSQRVEALPGAQSGTQLGRQRHPGCQGIRAMMPGCGDCQVGLNLLASAKSCPVERLLQENGSKTNGNSHPTDALLDACRLLGGVTADLVIFLLVLRSGSSASFLCQHRA